MDTKTLRNHLGELLKGSNFKKLGIGWFKTRGNHVVVVALQRSNFGPQYYLKLRLFIEGFWGPDIDDPIQKYLNPLDKKIATFDAGSIQPRFGDEDDCLDLENISSPSQAIEWLDHMVVTYVVPLSEELLTLDGLRRLHLSGAVHLLETELRVLQPLWAALPNPDL